MIRVFLVAVTVMLAFGCAQQKKTGEKASGEKASGEKASEAKKSGESAPPASTSQPGAKPEKTTKTSTGATTADPGTPTATASAPPSCGGAGGTAPSCGEPATADKKAGANDKPVGNVAATVAHFGGAFTLTDTMVLDDVVAQADKYTGKNIRIAAKVSKVCRKKGCWMVLAAKDGKFVRVKFKDYGFFVPKDCDGKKAVVEGIFTRTEVAEAMRKHLAEDGGEDPKKITGKKVELTMMATAVDIEG